MLKKYAVIVAPMPIKQELCPILFEPSYGNVASKKSKLVKRQKKNIVPQNQLV